MLVSTTIIESGLDIPNANTIIIDRADRFGLADLYQLRGRVGRAQHKAYAYLLLPRGMMTVGEARRRINAIKQYSTLGAGFQIAMRDLEIRGAGNILGTRRAVTSSTSGSTFTARCLSRQSAKLKGEKVQSRLEIVLRLDFVATKKGEPLPPAPKNSCLRSFPPLTSATPRSGFKPTETWPKSRPPNSYSVSGVTGATGSESGRNRLTICSYSAKSGFLPPGLVSAGSRCARAN